MSCFWRRWKRGTVKRKQWMQLVTFSWDTTCLRLLWHNLTYTCCYSLLMRKQWLTRWILFHPQWLTDWQAVCQWTGGRWALPGLLCSVTALSIRSTASREESPTLSWWDERTHSDEFKLFLSLYINLLSPHARFFFSFLPADRLPSVRDRPSFSLQPHQEKAGAAWKRKETRVRSKTVGKKITQRRTGVLKRSLQSSYRFLIKLCFVSVCFYFLIFFYFSYFWLNGMFCKNITSCKLMMK